MVNKMDGFISEIQQSYSLIVYPFLAVFIAFSCKPVESKKAEPIQNTETKPNIILIMSDDHGWYDTGFNGNEEIKTPNLDAMASNGVVLDRFYSASAVCSPTRASMLTGRNPLRTDVPYANVGHLKLEEITISEILKENGYKTAHFGKWHLGTFTKDEIDSNRGGRPENIQEYTIPTEHGYDEFFCTESKVPTYDPMLYPNTFIEGESKRFGWRAVKEQATAKNYGTSYWIGENLKETKNIEGDDSRVVMDRVIPFIEKSTKQNSPFFSTIWFHTPHLPVVSDSVHRAYYNTMDLQKQIYYGTITAMDEQIGRLWERLEALNIVDNTIVFYCSDNGPEVNTPGSAGAFRGRKRSLYEGGVRVPAIAVWKDRFNKGKRISFPAVTSDYMSTILDILNIDYPDKRPVDGVSILAALKGGDTDRETPIGFITRPNISWVSDQYKLISTNNGDDYELYDLINDESEKENIIEKKPLIADKMKSELSVWKLSVENSKNGKDYK